jgi:hypothetical protein
LEQNNIIDRVLFRKKQGINKKKEKVIIVESEMNWRRGNFKNWRRKDFK